MTQKQLEVRNRRTRILQAIEQGVSVAMIARSEHISAKEVRRVLYKYGLRGVHYAKSQLSDGGRVAAEKPMAAASVVLPVHSDQGLERAVERQQYREVVEQFCRYVEREMACYCADHRSTIAALLPKELRQQMLSQRTTGDDAPWYDRWIAIVLRKPDAARVGRA